MVTKKYAVGYLRVSTVDQADGDGWVRQEEKVRAWAASKGYTLLNIFKDSHTGMDVGFERPEFQEMDRYMTFHGIRDIIIERPDRWARDLIVSEVMLSDMMAKQRRVFCADGGIELTNDPDNPTSELIRRVLAVVDEYAKKVQMVRTRLALARARKTGVVSCGEGAYGWRCPAEKIIREYITKMARLGWSPHHIARVLNQNSDVFKPRKSAWQRRLIERVMEIEKIPKGSGKRIFPDPEVIARMKTEAKKRLANVTPLEFKKPKERVK